MFRSAKRTLRLKKLGLVVATTLLVALSSAAALAGDVQKELLDYLPADSRTAGVVDLQKLKQSKYFKDALDAVEKEAGNEDIGKLLQNEGELNLQKDIHFVAMGMPVARVQGGGTPERVVLVMKGDFERKKINAVLEKELEGFEARKVADGVKGWGKKDLEMALLDDEAFFVVLGPESYRKNAWKVAKGKAASFKKTAKANNLTAHLDTDRAAWFVSRPAQSSEGIEAAGIAVGVANGIDLQIVSHTTSADKAAGLIKQLEEAKSADSSKSMAAMFAATPLLTNLDAEKKGKVAIMTTSMTQAELDSMVAAVKGWVQATRGSQGGGALPIPQGSSPNAPKADDGDSEKQ